MAPDGTSARSGDGDGALILWNLETRAPRRLLAGADRPIWGVAISPDGRTALSGGSDGLVRHWSLATGREIER